MLLIFSLWCLIGCCFGYPSSMDSLDIIAELTDGQREILAVIDEYYYTVDQANGFWSSVPGSVTVGAMVSILSMAVALVLLCCWLRCKWAALFCVPIADMNSHLPLYSMNRIHYNRQSAIHDVQSLVPIPDSPPEYEPPPSYVEPPSYQLVTAVQHELTV